MKRTIKKNIFCILWLLLYLNLFSVPAFAEDVIISDTAETVTETAEGISAEDSSMADISADDISEGDLSEEIYIEDISEAEPPSGLFSGRVQEPACDTATYVNPLYADVISEEDLLQPDPYGIDVYSSGSSYVSVENAAETMRLVMKNRTSTVKLYVETDAQTSEERKAYGYEVVERAFAHTGVPTEGDYLRWQYAGYSFSISYSTASPGNLAISYTITYYTTVDQENELDALVTEVLAEIREKTGDDQKIRAIYDYICKNVTYDYTNLSDTSYKLKYTAYAALVNKTAVCQGYALLFYRLALECGIDARLISGLGNGGAHGWNIVQLNGVYYNLDATWDAGKGAYSYFLKCPDDFSGHTRDEAYDTASFHADYPMAQTNYENECQHEHIVTDQAVEATCCSTGLTEGSHCGDCNEILIAQTVIPMTDHSWVTDPGKAATCTKEGLTEGKHCQSCGQIQSEQQVIPAAGHSWVTDLGKAATCTKEGLTEGKHCQNCGQIQSEQQVIPAAGHSWVSDPAKAATCTKEGLTEGKHCQNCGQIQSEQQAIPAAGHSWVTDPAIASTCTTKGKTEGSHCAVCGEVLTAQKTVAKKAHTWGKWKTTAKATVSSPQKQKCTCEVCGKTKTRTTGKALTPKISVNVTSLKLDAKQSYTKLKVSYASGDYVKSWKSSDTSIVKVSGTKTGKATIKAQNKNGTAKITITLKSGKKATVKVTVKKRTTSVTLSFRSVTLKVGETKQLKAVIRPADSKDSVKYSSSNKKVATVTAKGVIKAVKAGTVKITVRSGSKKAACTVKVKK